MCQCSFNETHEFWGLGDEVHANIWEKTGHRERKEGGSHAKK